MAGKRKGRRRRTCESNIKMDNQECVGAWTGLFWLRIGTGGGRLWRFRFHRRRTLLRGVT